MKKLYPLIFIVLLAVSTTLAVVQMDFSKVEIEATKIAGSVYMIAGTDDSAAFSGGNIAVSVGEDGVLMVDAKYAQLGDKIKAAIRQIGGDAPKYIISTHEHGEHVSGNAAFSNTGAVFAHKNVRKRLLKSQPKEVWPVITFDNSLSFHMNGEEIQAIHYPTGHTDGDAIIFFKGSNVIHMGDHFFHKIFPFVDLDNGGTLQGYMANVKKVIDNAPADVKIIAGHGPVASLEDLKNFYKMMQETTTYITDKMKDGKSLETLTVEGLPEKYASLSWPFITTEKWIATIFNSFNQVTKK